MRTLQVILSATLVIFIACTPVMQNSRGSGESLLADEIKVLPKPVQGRGQITGVLSDLSMTGQPPLPGGVLILQDTPFGANTDINGRYYINNLRPGIYTVEGKCMAYYPVVIKNVKIDKGFTTFVDIRLIEHHLDRPDYFVEVVDSMISINAKAKTITINIGDYWKNKNRF